MTYKVKFEVDGDSVTYTVTAEQLKQDKNVRGKAYRRGSSTSSWEVKHIENIHDGGERG